MANNELRQRIAWEAARLMFRHEESELYKARLKAARRMSTIPVEPRDLPTNREIGDQIRVLAERSGGDLGFRDERLENPAAEASRKRRPRQNEQPGDRFHVYRALLEPLEHVAQKPQSHPEGDALYHSLQVFELARDELPYDEELLLAALLHDVGKAIDPQDHIGAALEALGGHITARTAWLIEHHTEANMLRDGALGVRSRRRLKESESFDELMLLSKCDRAGRRRGVAVGDVEDALNYLRDLADVCGDG
jgi:predicted HD phosphohydrolase